MAPETNAHSTTETSVLAVDKMIQKYKIVDSGTTFPDGAAKFNSATNSGVAVLTGSTGSMGASILANLVGDDRMKKIYTLNRSSRRDEPIHARHERRFLDLGLDTLLLQHPKIYFLECDTSLHNLGLPVAIYRQIQETVNVIINCAWKIHLNLALPAFEENIRSMRNLIILGKASAHVCQLRFIFISSISVAQSWDCDVQGPYPESILQDARFAVGNGYGESKYVAERILATSDLSACTLRVNQVCGGKPTGSWSTTQWFPSLARTAVSLGTLPLISPVFPWIPMDAMGRIVSDIVFSTNRLPQALNISRPRPCPAVDVLRSVAKVIHDLHVSREVLPVIGWYEWLSILEKESEVDRSAGDLRKFPLLKVMNFFCSGPNPERWKREGYANSVIQTTFCTIEAQEISSTLRNLAPIDDNYIELWVQYWLNHSLFEDYEKATSKL